MKIQRFLEILEILPQDLINLDMDFPIFRCSECTEKVHLIRQESDKFRRLAVQTFDGETAIYPGIYQIYYTFECEKCKKQWKCTEQKVYK